MEKVKIGIATVILLLMAMLPIPNVLPITAKAETQSIPSIEDPTPGYWDTSLYMIGKIAVAIILPESNGSIDPNLYNWTDTQIAIVNRSITSPLSWWANQNPNASVQFITEWHIASTSYEPITRSESEFCMLVIPEIMRDFGFDNIHWSYQVRDYANALREKFNSDWSFIIWVVNAFNDSDGMFEGGGTARASFGGPSLYMAFPSYKGIEWMNRTCAHEIGHMFWADDEYFPPPPTYSGYLNVSSIPLSGCLMDNQSWCLSGAPHGHNGTWGQIGWRDTDGDGIQDIVDTFPRVYLNSHETIGNKLNFTGTATVTPYPNLKNIGSGRNVTINRIQSVQYRIDDGTWQNATITPWKFKKLVRYPDYYEYKETYAVVNFTFSLELEPGEHFIEIRATNQWGNSGYANTTVTIPEFLETDLNKDGVVNIIDISIVAKAFGSKPGDENWNEIADLDKNGVVNILDISKVARDFGKSS